MSGNPMGISPMMQQPSPQQMQIQQGPPNPMLGPNHPSQAQIGHPNISQSQPAEHLDNISKVKSLVVPLRESLATTLKASAQLLQHNNMIDNGAIKGLDSSNQQPPRYDKHLEEFYSICDQIELHLKTSIQCMQQSAASQRYLPVKVATTGPLMDNSSIPYTQYLSTVRTQISYAKDIHDTLICAAQNISPVE